MSLTTNEQVFMDLILIASGVLPLFFILRAVEKKIAASNTPEARAAKEAKRQGRIDRQLDKRPVKITRRKRALTLPLEEKQKSPKRRVFGKGKEEKQRTYEQEGSLWFRLPAELRVQIYEEYVGRDEIRFLWSPESNKCRAVRTAVPMASETNILAPTSIREPVDVLPLLRTCRRIYLEAISILYKYPTYGFSSHLSFLKFAYTIPPNRFHTIKRLELDLGREELQGMIENVGWITNAQPCYHWLHHPLQRAFTTRFLHPPVEMSRKREQEYCNTDLPPPKTLLKSTFLNAMAMVVGRMSGLKRVSIVIRTVKVEDWISQRRRLFEWLEPVREMVDGDGKVRGGECEREVSIVQMGDEGEERSEEWGMWRVGWRLEGSKEGEGRRWVPKEGVVD